MSDSKEKETDRSSFDRRTFLKLSAFTGLAVGAAQLIPPFDAPSVTSFQRTISNTREEKWTTVAGFGSLAFSGNAGMASLGLACALGVSLALLVAVYLLPAWWQARYRLDDPPARGSRDCPSRPV